MISKTYLTQEENVYCFIIPGSQLFLLRESNGVLLSVWYSNDFSSVHIP